MGMVPRGVLALRQRTQVVADSANNLLPADSPARRDLALVVVVVVVGSEVIVMLVGDLAATKATELLAMALVVQKQLLVAALEMGMTQLPLVGSGQLLAAPLGLGQEVHLGLVTLKEQVGEAHLGSEVALVGSATLLVLALANHHLLLVALEATTKVVLVQIMLEVLVQTKQIQELLVVVSVAEVLEDSLARQDLGTAVVILAPLVVLATLALVVVVPGLAASSQQQVLEVLEEERQLKMVREAGKAREQIREARERPRAARVAKASPAGSRQEQRATHGQVEVAVVDREF